VGERDVAVAVLLSGLSSSSLWFVNATLLAVRDCAWDAPVSVAVDGAAASRLCFVDCLLVLLSNVSTGAAAAPTNAALWYASVVVASCADSVVELVRTAVVSAERVSSPSGHVVFDALNVSDGALAMRGSAVRVVRSNLSAVRYSFEGWSNGTGTVAGCAVTVSDSVLDGTGPNATSLLSSFLGMWNTLAVEGTSFAAACSLP
jgi:hypothetical protein